jgi:hypothetical protein
LHVCMHGCVISVRKNWATAALSLLTLNRTMGSWGKEKERSSRVACSEQVRSSEGSHSQISLEGDQSSPWDSKKESIPRRTQGRRCPRSQSSRKAISTLSDPAPSSGYPVPGFHTAKDFHTEVWHITLCSGCQTQREQVWSGREMEVTNFRRGL